MTSSRIVKWTDLFDVLDERERVLVLGRRLLQVHSEQVPVGASHLLGHRLLHRVLRHVRLELEVRVDGDLVRYGHLLEAGVHSDEVV